MNRMPMPMDALILTPLQMMQKMHGAPMHPFHLTLLQLTLLMLPSRRGLQAQMRITISWRSPLSAPPSLHFLTTIPHQILIS